MAKDQYDSETGHLLERVTGICDSATSFDVEFLNNEPNKKLELTYISWEDVDNAVTSARLYIKRLGQKYYLRQWTTVGAASLQSELRQTLKLLRDFAVGIEVKGATVNDKIILNLYGHTEYK